MEQIRKLPNVESSVASTSDLQQQILCRFMMVYVIVGKHRSCGVVTQRPSEKPQTVLNLEFNSAGLEGTYLAAAEGVFFCFGESKVPVERESVTFGGGTKYPRPSWRYGAIWLVYGYDSKFYSIFFPKRAYCKGVYH